MADDAKPEGDLPQRPADSTRATGAHPAQAPAATADRLPLLTMLGRNSNEPTRADGFLGALIAGAVVLVLALIVLTIAIGRAPQQASAESRPTQAATVSQAPTTYASPAPTGTRWTPSPIITGVPQLEPSYEQPATTAARPSSAAESGSASESSPADEEDADDEDDDEDDGNGRNG